MTGDESDSKLTETPSATIALSSAESPLSLPQVSTKNEESNRSSMDVDSDGQASSATMASGVETVDSLKEAMYSKKVHRISLRWKSVSPFPLVLKKPHSAPVMVLSCAGCGG